MTLISGGLPPATAVVSLFCSWSHFTGTMSTWMFGLAFMKASCRPSRNSSVSPSYRAQKKVTLDFCAAAAPSFWPAAISSAGARASSTSAPNRTLPRFI